MEHLTVGRIVHLVAERTDASREVHRRCQAATVVRVWTDEPKAYVNLVVTRDGSNDARYDGLGYDVHGVYSNAEGAALHRWATSCYEGQGVYEFHDPRECTVEPRG